MMKAASRLVWFYRRTAFESAAQFLEIVLHCVAGSDKENGIVLPQWNFSRLVYIHM